MHDAVKEISMFWIIPFVGILLSIAIIPLVNGDWWHHNFPKVSLFWGLPMVVAMYFLFPERLFHTGIEFCSFIALIGSLYVISSGIFIHGSFKPSPLTNCAFFALGAVLANMIGTAGASMVLVRPMLRINS
ncbi:MAG: sodium:proton antiporter, partial [bacterium]